ncbi:MAG: molecular chaperone TorD family protein [Bacteroidetes bacterium]|nr:molecular chaperone TorD family protein [Bacteroidota bacterium]
MNEKTYIRIEQARGAVFNIFTALLCQPEDSIIRSGKIFEKLAGAFSLLKYEGNDSISKLKEECKKQSDTELLVEYSRLFIGPFKLIAPPYSSLYFGSEYLMSDETMKVVEFYRHAGLDFNSDKIPDMPDHVAVECEFIYFLIFNGIKAFLKGNRKKALFSRRHQETFIQKHFIKWVPSFCGKVIEGTKNEYYKALAQCIKGFIECDAVPEFPSGKIFDVRQ